MWVEQGASFAEDMVFHFVGNVVLSGPDPPAKLCADAGEVVIECGDADGSPLRCHAWILPNPSISKLGGALCAPAWCARVATSDKATVTTTLHTSAPFDVTAYDGPVPMKFTLTVPYLKIAPAPKPEEPEEPPEEPEDEEENAECPVYVEVVREMFDHEVAGKSEAESKRKRMEEKREAAKRRRISLDAEDEDPKVFGLLSHMLR
eukprot:8739973-Pyramimonas_sp.AAC.1